MFKNQYDTRTSRRIELNDFDALESLLRKLSTVKHKTKRSANLISPAVYKEGTKRSNANVIEWAGWAAIDVDSWKIEGDVETAVRKKFGKYRFVCYSTASSTPAQPKFRLVFALIRRVPADEVRQLWFSMNTMAGFVVDRQTKDVSRMFYVPGDYAEKKDPLQFIFSGDGEYLDPRKLMDEFPPPPPTPSNFFDRLPPEVQAQVIEHRKAALTNTSYSWTSYRDCPFWPKEVATEYRTVTDDHYFVMYRIMVGIAGSAVRRKYPITPHQIAQLCQEFHRDTGRHSWSDKRNFETEAERALEFVYKNG